VEGISGARAQRSAGDSIGRSLQAKLPLCVPHQDARWSESSSARETTHAKTLFLAGYLKPKDLAKALEVSEGTIAAMPAIRPGRGLHRQSRSKLLNVNELHKVRTARWQ
jgi:hypothetical protein